MGGYCLLSDIAKSLFGVTPKKCKSRCQKVKAVEYSLFFCIYRLNRVQDEPDKSASHKKGKHGLRCPSPTLSPSLNEHWCVGKRCLYRGYFLGCNLRQQTNIARFLAHIRACLTTNSCCRLSAYANHNAVRHIPTRSKVAIFHSTSNCFQAERLNFLNIV